jgi:photosystem II stability/assembly factor-like uncharacterized protein
MQINKPVIALALVLLTMLAAPGCKDAQQNSNQQNSNQPALPTVTGKWVAQYRSPASKSLTGTALATFWYSSISVVSPEVVFVAGEVPDLKDLDRRFGVVIRTTDGGQNWKEILIKAPGMEISRLNSISFISPTTGWVVGLDSNEAPIVGKTTDAGETWAVSKLTVKQAPTSVFFADADNGWMGGATLESEGEEDNIGGPSDILVTTDGGNTWQAQRRVPMTVSDLFFLDKDTGWAAGHKGAIYHTTDGGRTWNQQRSELEYDARITDPLSDLNKKFIILGIHFVDRNNGFAAAASRDTDIGRILGTVNGGSAWTRKLIANGEKIKDVYFTSPTYGWALADYGKYVYSTSDGGRYWNAEPVDFEQDVPFHRLGGADASHVWAVGGGAIFVRVPQ